MGAHERPFKTEMADMGMLAENIFVLLSHA